MTDDEIMDEVYDQIMDHSTNSIYNHNLDAPTHSMHGHNPSCGDDITLQLKINNNIIEDASFTGYGCAISQSSTSIMLDTLIGKTIDEAKKIIDIYISMIDGKKIDENQKALLGDSIIFENISHMPARVKCALLSWRTLQRLLTDNN